MTDLSIPVVIGVFKGMGDLLSAAPVIREELELSREVHLLLFPNAALHEFCGLIDFAPHGERLHIHVIPARTSLREWSRFAGEMRWIRPGTVWVSPHAPVADSSWKVPLMLRLMQLLFWNDAELVGADTERLSWMFQRKLPVDRSLPLKQREWASYRLLRGGLLPELAPRVGFLPEIAAQRNAAPRYDLVIHPGATAQNRLWPARHYGALVAVLPREWRIAVVGLPGDVAVVEEWMPKERTIEYVVGTIRLSVETLASAAMLLVMDSGNMHFAESLGVPTLAVFGYHDPANVIDPAGCVETLYEPRFPCQPCDRAVCSQPEVYCMEGIEPRRVAERLKRLWEREIRPDLVELTHMSKDVAGANADSLGTNI